ncbi:hypothetical protein ACJX0J_014970, partial [Zea mays]
LICFAGRGEDLLGQSCEIFSDVVGSPYYVAPEVLKKRYGCEVDVWSAGVIIYILLSGVPPFWAESEQGIFKQVLKGGLDFSSDPWPSISESAKDLVRKMLNRDPRKRLTAHDALCHPWVCVDGVAPDKPLDSAVLTRLKQFSAMNKLKKMALRVIAENLSEDEIAGLKEMFKMLDTDNSGQITLEELKIGLKRVGANLKDSEITTLMEALLKYRTHMQILITKISSMTFASHHAVVASYLYPHEFLCFCMQEHIGDLSEIILFLHITHHQTRHSVRNFSSKNLKNYFLKKKHMCQLFIFHIKKVLEVKNI